MRAIAKKLTKKQWELVLSVEALMRKLAYEYTPNALKGDWQSVQTTYDMLLDRAISAARTWDKKRGVKYVTLVYSKANLMCIQKWKVLAKYNSMLSLEYSYIDDDQYMTDGSWMEDKKHKRDIDLVMDLEDAQKDVSKRDLEVINSIYGLRNESFLSMPMVADRFGVSKQRIRQIKQRATRNMRKKMEAYRNEAE